LVRDIRRPEHTSKSPDQVTEQRSCLFAQNCDAVAFVRCPKLAQATRDIVHGFVPARRLVIPLRPSPERALEAFLRVKDLEGGMADRAESTPIERMVRVALESDRETVNQANRESTRPFT
jgi:hypothetical protein